jgi:prepilin-type N-terminal cleavage/methylation domain-containing protein
MQRNKHEHKKHNNSQANWRISVSKDHPFVGHNKPFISYNLPSIIPFIGYNKPFVRVCSFFRNQAGVSLVELMITLAIFAIIGAFAMPSFREMLLNQATTSCANEFLTDLNFARSEAMKRGMRVEVCIPDAAQTNCNYGATWSGPAGRVIGVRDPAVPGVLDVIRVREQCPPPRTLRVPPGFGTDYTSISFFNNGLVQFRSAGNTIENNRAVTAVFELCHDRDNDGLMDPEVGRVIRIGPTGGIKITSPATLC